MRDIENMLVRDVLASRVKVFLAIIVLLSLSGIVHAAEKYMPFGERALPPYGHVAFCLDNPGECTNYPEPGMVILSKQDQDSLYMFNIQFNAQWILKTDQEIYNFPEKWVIPKKPVGDCEDAAMTKRKYLIEKRGYPPESLFLGMTRVTGSDGKPEGHIVLIIRSTVGDIVLDTAQDEIYFWHRRKRHKFVKVQNPVYRQLWHTIKY